MAKSGSHHLLPILKQYTPVLDAIDAVEREIRSHPSNFGKDLEGIAKFREASRTPLFVVDDSTNTPVAYDHVKHSTIPVLYTEEAARAKLEKQRISPEHAPSLEQTQLIGLLHTLTRSSAVSGKSNLPPVLPYFRDDLKLDTRLAAFQALPECQQNELTQEIFKELKEGREKVVEYVKSYVGERAGAAEMLTLFNKEHCNEGLALGIYCLHNFAMLPMLELVGRNTLLELKLKEAKSGSTPEIQSAKQAAAEFLSCMEAVHLSGKYRTEFNAQANLYCWDNNRKMWDELLSPIANPNVLIATRHGAEILLNNVRKELVKISKDPLVVETVRDSYRKSNALFEEVESHLLGSTEGMPFDYTKPDGTVLNLRISPQYRTMEETDEAPSTDDQKREAYKKTLDLYYKLKDRNIELSKQWQSVQDIQKEHVARLDGIIENGKFTDEKFSITSLSDALRQTAEHAGGYLSDVSTTLDHPSKPLLATLQRETDALPKSAEGHHGAVAATLRGFRGGLVKKLDAQAAALETQIDAIAEATRPQDMAALDRAQEEHKQIAPLDKQIQAVESTHMLLAGKGRREDLDNPSESHIKQQHKAMTKAGNPDADSLRDKLMDQFTARKPHPRVNTDSVANREL